MAKHPLPPGTTQKDIANDTGLSEGTVSKVLRGGAGATRASRLVSDWLAERGVTLQSLNILDHRQALFLFPDTSNRFFTEVAFQLAKVFVPRSISLAIASSAERADEELRLYSYYSRVGLDGLILVPSTSDSTLIEKIIEDNVPLVVLDRRPRREDGRSAYVQVAVDNGQGVTDIIKHLHYLGHRRIGFLTGPSFVSSAEERYQAYISTCVGLNITAEDDWIFHGDFSHHSGYEAGLDFAQRDLAQRATAILCANDAMAIGFLRALYESGMKVPADVSLVGFDGTEESRWVYPQLTTVMQQIPQIVRAASELLNRQMDGEEIEEGDRIRTVRPRLRVTGSVAPPSTSPQESSDG